MYTTGEYLKKNPGWHEEDSPWKAKQIIKLMERNNIVPKTICEIGCGAGEVLRQLQLKMPIDCMFYGYEISSQAFELCRIKTNDRLNFKLMDIMNEKAFFDIILLIDVIEHIEDYFNFLREMKHKSKYKIFHIPLDLSVQMVLRNNPLLYTRMQHGHIHYFTKDLALIMLKELGYEIIDNFYTAGTIELPTKTIKGYLVKLPRSILFAIHQDIAVRLMGGFGLMVLAR